MNRCVETDVTKQPTCYQPVKMIVYIKTFKLLIALALLCVSLVSQAQCPTIVSNPTVPLCAGESVTFEVINLDGSVSSWQTSTSYDFNGGLISGLLGLNQDNITFEEGFTQNTFIKAELLLSLSEILAGCESEKILPVEVHDPISINTISCDITEIDCETSTPILFTGEQDADMNEANIFIWQLSHDGTSWENIPFSNSPNISISQLPDEDIYLRRIINPVACDKDTSNVLHLPYVGSPDGGTIEGDDGSCVEDEPGLLTLTGYDGDIEAWEYSADGTNFSEIEDTEDSTNYTPQNIPGTHYYRVRVAKGNCEPVYSPIDSVEIHSTIENYLVTADQHVCVNEIPEDILGNNPNGGNGSMSILWLFSENTDDQWDNVPDQPEYIQFDAPLSTTTYYRRIVAGTYCSSISDTVAIYVSPLSDPGTFVENENSQTLCPGTEAAPIGITNFTGEILDWYQATNPNGEWTAMGHTDSIYNPGTIAFETYFKVAIKSGNCDSVWTDVYSIVFYDEISNNTIENNQAICEGSQPATLIGSLPQGGNNNIPFSFQWQYRTEFTEWSNAPGTNNQPDYTPQVLEETTLFRRIVTSGECPSDTSNTIEIEIDHPAETGNFSDNVATQHICPGETPATISIENYTGTIIDWYKADEMDGSWTSLDVTQDEYTPQPPTSDTTYFKVGIQSEFCDEVFSDVYSVLFHSEISNNTISDDQSLCPGENAQPLIGLTPEGATGTHDFLWQQKIEGGAWTDAPGTNSELSYAPFGLTESTSFRRLVFSGSCPSDTSNVVYIEQLEAPSGDFSGGGEYCPGDPLEITVTLEGVAPFVIQFNDGNETFTVDNINTNVHTITVTADTTTTYTFTQVWDANCTSDIMDESLVIIPIPEIGIVSAGPDTAICGLSLDLTGSPILEDYQTCEWTDENGNVLANSPQFTFTSQTPGDYDLTYTVYSEACNDSNSSTVNVNTNVFEAADAGIDQQICATSTTLSANHIDYGVGHWNIDTALLEISNPFDSLATLTDLEYGNSYTFPWISESINGVCPMDTSWVTISVDELSDAGELSASANEICEGNEVTFSLSDQVGTVNAWLFNDDVDGEQIVISDATTVVSDELMTNTEVTVVVQSGTCPADTTDTFFLNVSPPTNPGTLTSDQQVCAGENEGNIEMTDFEGEIVFWEFSTDNFQSSDTILSNQTSYAFQNLDTTTQFRTSVQSGVCEAAKSNEVTVEVLNEILTPFELQKTFCSNDEAIELNTLIDEDAHGSWNINGTNSNLFNPAEFANSEVVISFTNDENFCGGTTSETTFVNTFPEIEISAPEEVCGLNTEIEVASTAGTGEWSISDELVPGDELNSPNLEIMALSYGSHSITWMAENESCANQATQTLTFFEAPDAAEAGENKLLDFTYETRLEANQPETGTGTWSSDNTDLQFSDVHDPLATVRNLRVGKNNLRWTIINGNCPGNISEVVLDVKGLIIPDAFSPNGDNVNDRYVIRGLDAIGPASLKVWNRWGNVVLETTDYQNDWEGLNKNGNELPADTYYYLLNADGLNDVFKGFIVIQR